jgi:hypothetical protein
MNEPTELELQQDKINETFGTAKVAGDAMAATASAINSVKAHTRKRNKWRQIKQEDVVKWALDNKCDLKTEDVVRKIFNAKDTSTVKQKWLILDNAPLLDNYVRLQVSADKYAKVMRHKGKTAVFIGHNPPWFAPSVPNNALWIVMITLCLISAVGMFYRQETGYCVLSLLLAGVVVVLWNAAIERGKIFDPGDDDPFTKNTYAVWVDEKLEEPDSDPDFY